MGMDGGGLGHEQSTGSAGPLGIVLKAEGSMDVVLVRPEPGEGTEDDTMFEVHATDSDGLEELRGCRHGIRSKKVGSVGKLKCLVRILHEPPPGVFIHRGRYSDFLLSFLCDRDV